MKTIWVILLLVGVAFSATAQIDTNKPARFKTKIVLFEGKNGADGSSITISPSPEGTSSGNEVIDAGTTAGREYELKWKYIGRAGDKDSYHFTFTRMTKAGSSAKTNTSKDILFNGTKAMLFEDELHKVTLETPSEKDLKK
jgi:hypothetical protein